MTPLPCIDREEMPPCVSSSPPALTKAMIGGAIAFGGLYPPLAPSRTRIKTCPLVLCSVIIIGLCYCSHVRSIRRAQGQPVPSLFGILRNTPLTATPSAYCLPPRRSRPGRTPPTARLDIPIPPPPYSRALPPQYEMSVLDHGGTHVSSPMTPVPSTPEDDGEARVASRVEDTLLTAP